MAMEDTSERQLEPELLPAGGPGPSDAAAGADSPLPPHQGWWTRCKAAVKPYLTKPEEGGEPPNGGVNPLAK